MSSIPSLTDALKSLPSGRSAASNFAGTGWRGLPMSTNVEDQRGQNLLETQNDETKTLIGELRRLNALSSPARNGRRARNTGHWRCPAAGALASPGRRISRRRRPAGAAIRPAAAATRRPQRPGERQPPNSRPLWPTYAAMGDNHGRAPFGGGTGGGAAGGVPGLPGSPSGPALTREQRASRSGRRRRRGYGRRE